MLDMPAAVPSMIVEKAVATLVLDGPTSVICVTMTLVEAAALDERAAVKPTAELERKTFGSSLVLVGVGKDGLLDDVEAGIDTELEVKLKDEVMNTGDGLGGDGEGEGEGDGE